MVKLKIPETVVHNADYISVILEAVDTLTVGLYGVVTYSLGNTIH